MMEILIFDTTKELYKFLKESGGLEKLQLFRDTPQKSIPADNIGYVATNSKLDILGAASLYEEEPGVWFNELFEVAKEYQGQGIGRKLYEFIKADLEPEEIHGFCTTDENKSFWEHLGQECINEETKEMYDWNRTN